MEKMLPCFGMKVITITQKPGGSYSHPNYALDLAGSDSGIDFWYSQGCYKCIAGPWGYGTYFFTPCYENGTARKVLCADGVERYITLALTHSAGRYIKTQRGKVYKNGVPMYEEGIKGNATGNHIHMEVADGIQYTKIYDKNLKVYRMPYELDPTKVMYINTKFSKVKALKGLKFSKTDRVYIEETNCYEKIADEIIMGLWGNGTTRKKSLLKAGFTDDEISKIQKIVNEKLK